MTYLHLVTRATFKTNVCETTDTGHLTELLYDDGANDDIVVCAAHGGRIEPGTSEQAIELAAQLPRASCWACLGYDENADEFDQWHSPSTAIRLDDYPLLDKIADRGFETVISLHGLATEGLLVGGGIDAGVKQHVSRYLDEAVSADVETVSEGPYAGVRSDNFVNWLAEGQTGGLQLEQGPTVRADEFDMILTALEDFITLNRL